MINRILGHVETIRKGIETATIRNQVISNNIANAQTPGYLAKELKEVEFSEYLDSEYWKLQQDLLNDDFVQDGLFEDDTFEHRMMNRATASNDIMNDRIIKTQHEIVNQNEPIRANGNNVNLEKEMNELAKNNIAYQGMIQKLSMQFNMLKHVISDGER